MKPTRRSFLASAAAPALAFSATNSRSADEKPNLIREENAKEGADDWQLTRVRLDQKDGVRASDIEGYCSKQSVAAGETLDIFVSSKIEGQFTLEIFRTGFYRGKGARLMQSFDPLPCKPQVKPASTRGDRHLHECLWEPSVSLTIPAEWPSGVYLGRISTPDTTGKGYWQNYVVFIVKDDRPADICLQCSDNTWQAYNKWPDNFSIYTHPKGNQGPWADVSFDRPYGKYSQIY